MDEERVYRLLKQAALSLRPPVSECSFSLIQIANDHSIEVNLVFGRNFDRTRDLARCDLGNRPVIYVYRQASADSVAALRPRDETSLTARERFSVAHELGHCLAYLRYDFQPLSRRDDRQRYWQQERAMDEFAATLLAPPWLVERWLHETNRIDATCVFRLPHWAQQGAVSYEVVAKALCRAVPALGFLMVAEATRLRDKARIFAVLHSSAGKDMRLPNQHSHLDDECFLSRVVDRTGADAIHGCQLGAYRLPHVQIAWMAGSAPIRSRRKEFGSTVVLSGISYWICLMGLPEQYSANQNDLLSLVS